MPLWIVNRCCSGFPVSGGIQMSGPLIFIPVSVQQSNVSHLLCIICPAFIIYCWWIKHSTGVVFIITSHQLLQWIFQCPWELLQRPWTHFVLHLLQGCTPLTLSRVIQYNKNNCIAHSHCVCVSSRAWGMSSRQADRSGYILQVVR